MARKNAKTQNVETQVETIEENFVPEFTEENSEVKEWGDKTAEWHEDMADLENELEFEDIEGERGSDNIEDLVKELGFDRKIPKEEIVCNVNGTNVAAKCRIELAANPKRPGSRAHERYEAYSKAQTVGEYLENGGLKADLRYDQMKGYLVIKEAVRDGRIIELKK